MNAPAQKIEQAKFSQSRNDMYWSLFDLDDGFVRWAGYDDANWWDNVATKDGHNVRTGKITGKRYELNYITGDVLVTPKVSA